jgi:hypothetical protein
MRRKATAKSLVLPEEIRSIRELMSDMEYMRISDDFVEPSRRLIREGNFSSLRRPWKYSS